MFAENSIDQGSRFAIQMDGFSDRDIKQLIQIHRREIHSGFLTSLGDKILVILFSLAVESKHSLLLTVKDVDRDEQIGFLLGTLDTGLFYKDFFRKKLFSAVLVLFPKIFSFSTAKKMIEVLLYPSKQEALNYPDAELLDIAISSKYQGLGLAKQLFNEFSAQLYNVGIREFKITTGEQLEGAQRFYEGLGAVKTATIEVHKGKKTIVYIYKIPA